MNTIVLACDMSALTGEQRKQHHTLVQKFLGATRERIDLPHGYEFRIDRDAMPLGDIGEWIDLESRCCPFLDFRLDLNAGASAIALQVTAEVDVKEFLRAELGLD